MGSSYPTFVPSHFVEHPIMGEIAVYKFKRVPRVTGCGSQTSFFRNGASPNNPKQYGIKMFNTSIEAFAAYQRQCLAAEEGLAPPVGCMVQWVISNKNGRSFNRWGYQTCVADTSDLATMKAQILGCLEVMNFFKDYCDHFRVRHSLTKERVCAFFKHFHTQWMNGEHNIDPYNVFDTTSHPLSLKSRIMKINIRNTQYDDISQERDDDHIDWKGNGRLRLGEMWDAPYDDPYMSNDLHRGNLGLWKGTPVVIDFGFHIACPGYRVYFSSSADEVVYRTKQEASV